MQKTSEKDFSPTMTMTRSTVSQTRIALISSHHSSLGLDTEHFVAAVSSEWEQAFPFTGVELDCQDAPSGCTFDTLTEFNKRHEAIASHLITSPRGTWASMSQRLPTGDTFHDILMSDGYGTYVVVSSTGNVTERAAREKIIFDEVYAARKAHRRELYLRQSQVALAANGWRVGTVLRNASVGGKTYRELKIGKVHSDGAVLLEGLRRGVRTIEELQCHPTDIEVPMETP